MGAHVDDLLRVRRCFQREECVSESPSPSVQRDAGEPVRGGGDGSHLSGLDKLGQRWQLDHQYPIQHHHEILKASWCFDEGNSERVEHLAIDCSGSPGIVAFFRFGLLVPRGGAKPSLEHSSQFRLAERLRKKIVHVGGSAPLLLIARRATPKPIMRILMAAANCYRRFSALTARSIRSPNTGAVARLNVAVM